MTSTKVPPSQVGYGRPGGIELEERARDNVEDVEQLRMLPAGQLLKDAEKDVRLGFVRKVYGLLSVQMILTVLIAAPLQTVSSAWLQSNNWMLSIAVFGTIVTMCAMACCQSVTRNYPTNYICLFGFTFFEAIVVGFVSASYTWQSVLLCAVLTTCVFLGLSIFAFTTKTDFTGAGPYLFGALMTLCFWGLMCMILSMMGVPMKWAVMMYDLIAVLIFVCYIVYDTQMIIGGNHAQHQFSVDDYVFAALNLYMDIIQLFLHLLRLLGEKNGE